VAPAVRKYNPYCLFSRIAAIIILPTARAVWLRTKLLRHSQRYHSVWRLKAANVGVELPYDGGELSLMVLLPDSGAFEQFEGSLSRDRAESVLKALQL